MSTSIFHINPATGNPNACRAKKGRCPFGGEKEHFGSKEDARAAFEATQSMLPQPERAKAPRVTSCGEAGAHNLYVGIPRGVPPKEGEHCDLNYFSERDADRILDEWLRPSRTNEVSLSLQEALAINFYQGKGYTRIASGLRHLEELTPVEQGHVRNLKLAMSKTRLSAPLTLFRGVHGEHAKALAKLRPGELIEEKAFVSTSPSEKQALGFTRGEGVMLQIEAPAGTPAIDIGAGEFSIDEDELLLGAGKFQVESSSKEILDGTPITRLVLRPLQ